MMVHASSKALLLQTHTRTRNRKIKKPGKPGTTQLQLLFTSQNSPILLVLLLLCVVKWATTKKNKVEFRLIILVDNKFTHTRMQQTRLQLVIAKRPYIYHDICKLMKPSIWWMVRICNQCVCVLDAWSMWLTESRTSDEILWTRPWHNSIVVVNGNITL